MHTNIQYMTCYMSIYKYILLYLCTISFGYYRSKCKISRTVHYLGHSGVSIEQLMHSNNATGRMILWARGYRRKIMSKHTEYEHFNVEFIVCIVDTTHHQCKYPSTWFRKTKNTDSFVFVDMKFKFMFESEKHSALILRVVQKQISWSSWSSLKVTDDCFWMTDWQLLRVSCWTAATLEVVMHAHTVCVCCVLLWGQSEPDFLTACAVHLINVAHHRISSKTWESWEEK